MDKIKFLIEQNIQDIILLDRNGEIVTSVMPLDIQFLQDLQHRMDLAELIML